MKIKLTHGENRDNQAMLDLEVDGALQFSAYPGEPEDFSLERDLDFVYGIVPLMRKAWEAGKNGEGFEVEEKEG